ncbi:hypothetical protein F5X96DRAFT_664167 [Biscogniauxia mediterranea]|nr:hypothetical protein F5X96DRAFT_664167 [Biscogniauxia mediterranea]
MPSLKRVLRKRKSSRSSYSDTPSPSVEHPQGLEVVFEGVNPIVDIVAIHGLNGHREKTWTAKNGVHWLRDLLPTDLPNARIMCWGYDANTHSTFRTSRLYIHDYGESLLSELNRKRKLTNTSRRPIIFIAHSLGGLVLKSALVRSDIARQGALLEYRSIKLSTYGIFFMGTPHRGGHGVKLGLMLAKLGSPFIETNDRILRHLALDSEWLQQLSGQYAPISSKFVTKFAYEKYALVTAFGKEIFVVSEPSAIAFGQANGEPIGIHKDHREMVRFDSREDGDYINVVENLRTMINDAERVTRSRWWAETTANTARGNDDMFSLVFSSSGISLETHFVAREEELAEMFSILTTSHDRRTIAIHGASGIGKTQLAIEFARRYRNSYSAVIWLNATDETTLTQSLVKTAERIFREHPSISYLKSAVINKNADGMIKAVKRWLDEPNNKYWLVICDNYGYPQLSSNADSDDNDGGSEDHSQRMEDSQQAQDLVSKSFNLRVLLPESCQGAMIITTRSSTIDADKTIRLSKLEHIEDSLQILEIVSKRRSLRQDPAAIQLVEQLDGLPFALSTAGTYLRRQISVTCGEYLKQYEASRLLLQDRSAQLSPHDRILHATWNVSYMHIEQQNKSAAMLLKLWACFSREDLWYELLCVRGSPAPRWLQALTADKPTFEQGMRLLCDYGLAETGTPSLELGSESPGYSMHSCMHAWMEHALREAPDNHDLPRLAIACVSSHVLDTRHRGTQRRLSPHVDRCAAMMMMARGGGDEAAPDAEPWMCQSLGSFYLGQGRFREAEHMYRRALRGKQEALGPAHVSTLDTVQGLGILYADQGQLGEAQDMYERALRGYAEVLGPASSDAHVSVLECCANLGRLRCRQGRLLDARQCYLRAWQGYSSVFGPDSKEARIMAMRLEEMESLREQHGLIVTSRGCG